MQKPGETDWSRLTFLTLLKASHFENELCWATFLYLHTGMRTMSRKIQWWNLVLLGCGYLRHEDKRGKITVLLSLFGSGFDVTNTNVGITVSPSFGSKWTPWAVSHREPVITCMWKCVRLILPTFWHFALFLKQPIWPLLLLFCFSIDFVEAVHSSIYSDIQFCSVSKNHQR